MMSGLIFFFEKTKNPHEICRHLHNGQNETDWEDFVRGTNMNTGIIYFNHVVNDVFERKEIDMPLHELSIKAY